MRFVVEGTVRRMGDRVRISVQLTTPRSGRQVWAERFDRAQAEIFDVQDEVVQTIVSTLSAACSPPTSSGRVASRRRASMPTSAC